MVADLEHFTDGGHQIVRPESGSTPNDLGKTFANEPDKNDVAVGMSFETTEAVKSFYRQ